MNNHLFMTHLNPSDVFTKYLELVIHVRIFIECCDIMGPIYFTRSDNMYDPGNFIS